MPALYPTGVYVPPAAAIYTAAAPTAPASTSVFAMQGLGALLTPATISGTVMVTVYATLTDSATTVGNGVILQLYYGPMVAGVAAPANAAAVLASAVAIGSTLEWASGVTLTTAADLFQPITLTGVVKGLLMNTQYWFDVAAKSVITASNVALTNVTTCLVEIA